MKRIFLIFGLGSLALTGCKEEPPLIYLTTSAPKVDTTYVVSPVPAAEPHNVLIEDFTGATCTNCPAAHETIVSLEDANPGRINAMGLYIKNYPQTEPPTGAKYDFRTDVATLIQGSIFRSLIGMPIGGIDRQALGAVGTPLQIDASNWSSVTANRLTIADSINLAVTSTYDDATKKEKIKITVVYLYPTSLVHNISLAIVEDSFVDKQEDNRKPNYLDTAYHFNGVLRGLVTTAPYGDKIAPQLTAKVAGQVYERTYTFNWNTAWNPAHCRVIAYVTNDDAAGGTNVYQSKQAKIKP